MSIFSHRSFVNSPEAKLVLFCIFIQQLKRCASFIAVLQYHRYILAIGNCRYRLLERCCQDRNTPWVCLSLFPRLSLRSVKFSIIYILTLPERHKPIKRPSGGVAFGLYFHESSRRAFTASAWLHVPDRPHGYSAACKKEW